MKRKQQQNVRVAAVLAFGIGLCLIAQTAAAEIYSWRTEDGGYAYTDDKDQIPARYANQVKALGAQKLSHYERFTPQDDAASERYAEKLSERLEYLRAMNTPAAVPTAAGNARAVASQNKISFSTGGENSPQVEIATDGAQGPLVVEPVVAKNTGDSRTRSVTVIRQGGETLAVIKSSPRNFNPSNDIYDEQDLVDGAPID